MRFNARRLAAGAVVLGAVGLLIFWKCGPMRTASVVAWSGAAAVVIGLISVLVPLRFMGIMTRAAGALIMAGGLMAVAGAMLWPAPSPTRITQRRGLLDDVLPVYHFQERHEILVHAPPERIAAVWNNVTAGEIGYAEQFVQSWVQKGWLATTVCVPALAGIGLSMLADAIRSDSTPTENTVVAVESFPAVEGLRPFNSGRGDRPQDHANSGRVGSSTTSMG